MAGIDGLVAIASAIAVAGGAIASGIAEASIGAAAMGAVAEKPENFGTALILTVIPETLVILAFVISILLIFG